MTDTLVRFRIQESEMCEEKKNFNLLELLDLSEPETSPIKSTAALITYDFLAAGKNCFLCMTLFSEIRN
jgi:hypothetical protein